MNDYLHDYNAAVKLARTRHRQAVKGAEDRRTQAQAVITTRWRQELANAAAAYKLAMDKAEADYDKAKADYDANPPF